MALNSSIDIGTVLITGAAQGIGAAVANELSNYKVNLVLLDKNISGLANTSKSISAEHNQVQFFACDLTDPNSIARIVNTVIQQHNAVDILINNAGITHDLLPITEIDHSTAKHIFDVNYFAPLVLAQQVLPIMQKQQKGLIINITSAANIHGYKHLGVYSSSKAALSSLTDTIATENMDTGVKAIDIVPSRTNTPLQVQVRGAKVAENSQSPQFVAEIIRKVITEEISTQSGDDIRIQNGKFLVEHDLFEENF